MSKSNKEKRRLLNIVNYKNGKEFLSENSIKIKLRISFLDDINVNFHLNGNNTCNFNLGKHKKHLKRRVKNFYSQHGNTLIEYKKSLKSIITKNLQKSLMHISKNNNNYNWNIHAIINLNYVLNPELSNSDLSDSKMIKITFIVNNPIFEGTLVFSDYKNTPLNFEYLNYQIISSPDEIISKIDEIQHKNVYILLEPSSYPYNRKSFFFDSIKKIKLFKKNINDNYHIKFEKRIQLSILIGENNYYRFVKEHNKKEINFEKIDLDNNLDILKNFIFQNYFGDKTQYDEIINCDDFESVANFVSLLDY